MTFNENNNNNNNNLKTETNLKHKDLVEWDKSLISRELIVALFPQINYLAQTSRL